MIPQGVQVFIALQTVDLRCSFDRLSGVAKEQIGYDARSGALFVFCGRRRDALKVLFFDGSGMCIFYNQRSSHYTSFESRRGPSFPHCDVRAARSASLSQRLQCLVGGVTGSS